MKPSVLSSTLATLSSLFLSPLSLEGFVFLKEYPSLGKHARNLGIAKLTFFLCALVLAVVSVSSAVSFIKDDKDMGGKKIKTQGVKEVALLGATSLTAGVFGILSIASFVLCLVSFSRIKT